MRILITNDDGINAPGLAILHAIAAEILQAQGRAEAKHGKQTHLPDGTGPDEVFKQLDRNGQTAAEWALFCKYRTDMNAAAGKVTWFDILLEEVAEASEQDDLAERALRGANLWEEVKNRLTLPGSGLSGGQQQRLCIARAIAMAPDVLLMDEPCSALDPISTLAIEDLIGELKEQYTIVIVTHNMQQAARVSDTTAFFNIAGTGAPGKLIETGPTEKIFSTPVEKATEDYITGRFG